MKSSLLLVILHHYWPINGFKEGEKRISYTIVRELMSSKYEAQDDIERRIKFYTSDGARKHLKKYGVPKTNMETKDLIATMFPDADQDTIESVRCVHFQIHPQQINITDKTNGKLIVSIET